MSLGNAWDTTTAASVSKLNTSTVIYGTGTYLNTLDKTKHKIVVCTETSGGLTLDHIYLANVAGDEWIDVSSVGDHAHDGVAGQGGDIATIFSHNWKFTDLFLSRITDLQKANWIQTVTGTGSIEDATDGTTGERSIRLRPNGTTASGSTISYPHLSMDFSQRSFYEAKVRIETATSLAFHTGVNCDDVTAADSNTIKYNAEVCTTTNNNWWLRTASGSANSTSDTGIAISTSRTYLFIDHFPAEPETDLYVGNGTVLQKTSNIPVTGSSAHVNLIKHSIKNSTGADRPIHIYPSRLRYTIADLWA